MNILEKEQQKLDLIKTEYQSLIKTYEARTKRVMHDYKNNTLMQNALIKQYTMKIALLNKNLSNPFFGRIDFTNDSDLKEEICYLGKVGVLDENGSAITIDWRSPIATLYYDSNIGHVQYEAPGGTITGNLNLKRQFDIKDGKILSYQDVNIVTNDELLKPYLEANSDNRLKNIVATIQSEQNAIIREKLYSNIIVQGAAGSGKTTVALHRIAYLVYNEEKNYKENEFMVIGPNSYFMKYISGVLPDLDVHTVTEYTLLDIVNNYLGDKLKIIDQNTVLENILSQDQIDASINFKSSLKFKEAIDNFISDIEAHILHGPISYQGIILFTEDEINKFLAKKTLGIMERIKEFIKYAKKEHKNKCDDYKHLFWLKYRDEYLSLDKSNPRRTEILNLTNDFNKKIENIDSILKEYFKVFSLKPLMLYKLFIENIHKYTSPVNFDLPKLQSDTLNKIKAKTLGYEDLPSLIYLNLIFNGYKGYDKYIHVVIDEAQDLGLFHFAVLKQLFKNATFSIFGDMAQSIYSYQSIHDWNEVVTQIFASKIKVLSLDKSYRTTCEIMDTANLIGKLYGYGNAKSFLRHGSLVEAYNITDFKTYLLARIQELENTDMKNIAIICKDAKEVNSVSKMLSQSKIEHQTFNKKEISTSAKIWVIPSYLSKGLEFDSVIIYNIENYDIHNELDMKLLYVSLTRALHKLDITYTKKLIEPLQSIPKKII